MTYQRFYRYPKFICYIFNIYLLYLSHDQYLSVLKLHCMQLTLLLRRYKCLDSCNHMKNKPSAVDTNLKTENQHHEGQSNGCSLKFPCFPIACRYKTPFFTHSPLKQSFQTLQSLKVFNFSLNFRRQDRKNELNFWCKIFRQRRPNSPVGNGLWVIQLFLFFF